MRDSVMSAVTRGELLEMTSEIVCAYVGHNTLPPGELPSLIESVHRTLCAITAGTVEEPAPPPE